MDDKLEVGSAHTSLWCFEAELRSAVDYTLLNPLRDMFSGSYVAPSTDLE
jgi:hypothetical protein